MKKYKATMKEIVSVKCLECMGGDSVAVQECDSADCPLASVRPSSRPDSIKKKYWDEVENCLKAVPVIRRREMSEEQRQAAGARMKEMQRKKGQF